jgi:hypothetical protein
LTLPGLVLLLDPSLTFRTVMLLQVVTSYVGNNGGQGMISVREIQYNTIAFRRRGRLIDDHLSTFERTSSQSDVRQVHV